MIKQLTFAACYGCHRIEFAQYGCHSCIAIKRHKNMGWDYLIDYVKRL